MQELVDRGQLEFESTTRRFVAALDQNRPELIPQNPLHQLVMGRIFIYFGTYPPALSGSPLSLLFSSLQDTVIVNLLLRSFPFLSFDSLTTAYLFACRWKQQLVRDKRHYDGRITALEDLLARKDAVVAG